MKMLNIITNAPKGKGWFNHESFNEADLMEYVMYHETEHYNQQANEGFANFYGKVIPLSIKSMVSFGNSVYMTKGSYDYLADKAAFEALGYYYTTAFQKRSYWRK